MKLFWVTVLISAFVSLIGAIMADIWLSERMAIVGSFAGLQYSLNPGIAFGIRLPPGIQELLIGIALVLVLQLARSARQDTLSQGAFGLIIGGGLANIVDRLRDGFVTDYFQVGQFPIFNVADSCVSIGVAMLLFSAIFERKSDI